MEENNIKPVLQKETSKQQENIDIDKILTPEEKEVFKKAGDISREFLDSYELSKQKVELEESTGKKM